MLSEPLRREGWVCPHHQPPGPNQHSPHINQTYISLQIAQSPCWLPGFDSGKLILHKHRRFTRPKNKFNYRYQNIKTNCPQAESNYRPSHYKCDALPLSYRGGMIWYSENAVICLISLFWAVCDWIRIQAGYGLTRLSLAFRAWRQERYRNDWLDI